MFTLTLTNAMTREFSEIFQTEKSERGSIGARNYALSVMITKRRATLLEYVEIFPYQTVFDERIQEAVKLNSELILLLIERGA